MNLYQVARDGQTLGEFDESQIREGLQTGYFQPADWCWREGMSEWKGLESMLQQTVKPLPLPRPTPAPAPVINPYAAPLSRPAQAAPRALIERASAGSRLAALILDYISLGLCFMPSIVAEEMKAHQNEDLMNTVSFGLFVILCIVNLILIATEGQTVGKKLMRIRIAEMDDSAKAGFLRIVFLRTLIGRGLLNLVPLYGLVDALFIFNEDRRCLHDKIGGTHVIKV
jgi:uncharacterized RDD family membrane protein YckC